jgi:uncharacterized membrane protein (DUF441 family)
MTFMAYLKAAGKTVAAVIVGWLATRGIDVDGQAMEIVVTGIFIGVGSIAVNLFLVLVQKTPFGEWAAGLLPSYEHTE